MDVAALLSERQYTQAQQAWIDALMRVLRNAGDRAFIEIQCRPKSTPRILVRYAEVKQEWRDTQGADWLV